MRRISLNKFINEILPNIPYIPLFTININNLTLNIYFLLQIILVITMLLYFKYNTKYNFNVKI